MNLRGGRICAAGRLALRYADAGLSVFPCRGDATKRPLVKWRSESTTDAATIAAWWDRWPRALVAIDLTKAGLVVIDADRHQDGADGVQALASLVREHGTDLSASPVTQTPSNGFHLYFRQPEREPLGNGTGELPAGIDVRGYSITARGNVRPDGKTYRAAASHPELIAAFKDGTIPTVPKWLVETIRPKVVAAPITITRQSSWRGERYARAALGDMARKLAGMARESGRNKMLNAFAWRMGTMMARGWTERAEIEQVLFQAARSCRLVEDTGKRSVEATIKSGLDAGLTHPHPDLQCKRRK